jgi:hypothetical protein
LVKKYYSGETKEHRKARKALEKAQKSAETHENLPQESVAPVMKPHGHKDKYIVCLKWGNKYDASYVNNLYNMVKRNCTLDYEFVCFTDNTSGINEEIRTEPIPQIPGMKGAIGWWYKPMFFNSKFPLRGTLLYFDLDVIIFRNINNLFTYKPGEFIICRDFNRFVIKNYQKFNSSVFRIDSGQHRNVYDDFVRNPSDPIRRWHGDQDWIRAQIKKDFNFWPEEWIQSYKWEMRGKPRMVGAKGKRDFEKPGDPKILDDTNVAVFHGDPNPHYCKDLWVRENWK